MTHCYLCNNPLTAKNASSEHILLNSIGGHLKSKELLCNSCNSSFGHQADSELSKQLSFLSSFLQVKRDSGKNQIIKGCKTKNGEEYHIVNGSKPTLTKPKFEKSIENGKSKYSITARNEQELLNIFKGLRKKHPELDMEIVKQKFQWKKDYLDEPLHYNTMIGGDLSFKSIVKTAINYYIYSQHDTKQVEHLFDYLRGCQELKIVKHFYPSNTIYKRDSNEIIHLIHLVGIKYSKLLYCYIEYFSSYSFLVLLSDNFDGKNFSSTYGYDIIKGKEVSKIVRLKLTKEEVNDISNISTDSFPIITAKLSRVMAIANKIQTDKEISNIVSKAIDRVFNKYKHEPVITEQMIKEFSEEVSMAYVKFVYRGKKEIVPGRIS